jgi:hypothetical protein
MEQQCKRFQLLNQEARSSDLDCGQNRLGLPEILNEALPMSGRIQRPGLLDFLTWSIIWYSK